MPVHIILWTNDTRHPRLAGGRLLLSKGIEGPNIIRDQQEWPGVEGIVFPSLSFPGAGKTGGLH